MKTNAQIQLYEEWNSLVLAAKEGYKEAKEEILNNLRPLIISSIQKYYNRRDFYEELIQEGDLCILEAIDNFEFDQNTYFLGYVKVQLKFLYLNKNREKVLVSLNTKIGEKKEDEILDTIESNDLEPVSSIIDREIKRMLGISLDGLAPRQRETVEMFYSEKLSISQIAQKQGVSYRTVVNTKTRAIDKLRESFDKVGLLH